MLFNSIDFAIFLPVVFGLYWLFKKSTVTQNVILLISSYIFYGWWDWRFLSLIAFSTIVDFIIGKLLQKDSINPKVLLGISLSSNLGLLVYFKYYNFFLDNFIEAFTFFGSTFSASQLNIILPVGISFYTFQTLSYTIDVYRKKIPSSNDLIAFSAFVSFFPQLVAGPIERASHLLPQFKNKREFNYTLAADGCRQALWGLFKKIVIADNCAEYVNIIFANHENLSGSTLFLGALLFSFQIYCDFSGYSDIAIGISRLFGFDLMKNFAYPYFSRDIAEFWRRWHISLSSWFRDYLYIPLGGSKGGLTSKIRNTIIIFLVSGFWHGANWTFIVWGLLNAIYFLPLLIFDRNRNNLDVVSKGSLWIDFRSLLRIVGTFILTTLTWIFFRSDNITQATDILTTIFSSSLFDLPQIARGRFYLATTLFFIIIMTVVEWLGRMSEHPYQAVSKLNWPARWSIYFITFLVIFFFGGKEQEFVYFQF